MADLAPRNNDKGLNDLHANDPFATPTLAPVDLPTPPEPVAQAPSISDHETNRRPTALYGGRVQHETAAYPYKSSSMSSTGDSSTMTAMSSIDLEKSSRREPDNRKHHHKSSRPAQPQRTSRDPEKQSPSRSSRQPDRVAYLEDDEADQVRQRQEEKAVKTLFFFAGPCVVLSFLNVFWTLISLIITSLAQPVRLCARRPTFGQQLGGLLGPALNLQLKSIYTPLPPHADEDTSYRPGMLLAVQLLSPFLSMGMMIAAWIVTVFWLSSAVVGDPAGLDKRDDGRETVLALRDWWESWLVRSMRED